MNVYVNVMLLISTSFCLVQSKIIQPCAYLAISNTREVLKKIINYAMESIPDLDPNFK